MSSVTSTTITERFYIAIEGIPIHYTWQDLKDHVRPVARTGLCTDIMPPRHGRGYKEGGVRVGNRQEARDVYAYLHEEGIDGRHVHIVLWNITQLDGSPRFLLCNYNHVHVPPREWNRMVADAASERYQPVQEPHIMLPQHAISYSTVPMMAPMPSVPHSGAVQYPSNPTQDAAVHPAYPSLSAESMQYLALQRSQTAPTTRQAVYASPTHATTANGLPINMSNGGVATENRNVFVRNLPFNVSAAEIEVKFSAAGTILNCTLQTDRSSGRSRGTATMLYVTAESASRACRRFNGHIWDGRPLTVRLSHSDQTPVGQPHTRGGGGNNSSGRPRQDPRDSPLIANGSEGQGTERQGTARTPTRGNHRPRRE